MKTIIAGGRNYSLTAEDFAFLSQLTPPITEVVSGGARGADYGGEKWGWIHNVPVVCFPANWAKHGPAAGPIRNAQMAAYAERVVLFPGGRGTESMRGEAKERGLIIVERGANQKHSAENQSS